MPDKKEKIKALYSYLLEKGFDNSIEEIAAGIGVAPATIYNRYQSRKGVEIAITQYWMEEIAALTEEKCQYANNPIEEILYFIHELNVRRNEAAHIYQKSIEISEINSIRDIIYPIIENGIKRDYFQEEANSDEYIKYFTLNLIHTIFTQKKIESRFLYYLLEPILTSVGEKALSEIDLAAFFK